MKNLRNLHQAYSITLNFHIKHGGNMKIALIQTDIAWNDPAENVIRCEKLAEDAISTGAEILVFPEMFTSGFSSPTGSLAVQSEQEGRSFLSRIASTHSVYTIASIPEVTSDGALYNTAVTFSPAGVVSEYRKIHLFSYGDEHREYSPGSTISTTTLLSATGESLRCTVCICYDLRFADIFLTRAHETDIFIVVANWPSSRREHWLTLLRARATETQSFIAGVNRVGFGGGLGYTGDSSLFAPDGTELALIQDKATFTTLDIQQQSVIEWRKTFPALRDRRESVYEQLRKGSN
jgi:predicted amidohydrolase